MLHEFHAHCLTLSAPKALELGARRPDHGASTLRKHWVPNHSEYIGSDIEPGPDVDRVADVHRLSQVFGEESFDVILSCSTFEHFKYPNLAAHEIMKTLKVGGTAYVQTHQTFPLHGAPYDYCRFSKEGLVALFGARMGFVVETVDFEFPARIHSKRDPNSREGLAYLNVSLWGRKVAATPAEYIYELDCP